MTIVCKHMFFAGVALVVGASTYAGDLSCDVMSEYIQDMLKKRTEAVNYGTAELDKLKNTRGHTPQSIIAMVDGIKQTKKQKMDSTLPVRSRIFSGLSTMKDLGCDPALIKQYADQLAKV